MRLEIKVSLFYKTSEMRVCATVYILISLSLLKCARVRVYVSCYFLFSSVRKPPVYNSLEVCYFIDGCKAVISGRAEEAQPNIETF